MISEIIKKYDFFSISLLFIVACSSSNTSNIQIQNNAPTTPTSIKLIDPVTSPGHNPTPTLLVTGLKPDESVNIYSNSTCSNLVTSENSVGTSAQITLSSLEDGTFHFYVQTRTSGGFSPCVGPATYQLDTVKPSAPTITFPTNGSMVGGSATIVGACEQGATVYFSGDITPIHSVCSNNSYSIPVVFTTGNGSRDVSVDQIDRAGNTSTTTTFTYDKNSSLVAVSINQANQQSDPTNISTISFTIVFSTAITASSFTAADIANSGTATGVTFKTPTTSDSITWTVQTLTISGNGTIIPTIAAGRVVDGIGNTNGASTSIDNSVTYDATSPSVTIDQASTQADPTNDPGISFTIVFSEAIDPTTFDSLDITNSGTATGVMFSTPTTSDNITWTLTTSVIGTDGTVIPSISAGQVLDAAGNSNSASTSSDHSVTYTTTGPSVTINQAMSQVDPTHNPVVTFTIVFNEAIDPTTFDSTDIVNLGTASGVVFDEPITSDNITWTLTTTSIGSDGTVVLSIPASSVSDDLGNENSNSTSDDNSVMFDTTAPTLAIQIPMTAIDLTNQSSYSFSGSCDEDNDSITITAPVELSGTSTTCSSSAFTFSNLDVSSIPDGTVLFTVLITDSASNSSSDTQSADKNTN